MMPVVPRGVGRHDDSPRGFVVRSHPDPKSIAGLKRGGTSVPRRVRSPSMDVAGCRGWPVFSMIPQRDAEWCERFRTRFRAG